MKITVGELKCLVRETVATSVTLEDQRILEDIGAQLGSPIVQVDIENSDMLQGHRARGKFGMRAIAKFYVNNDSTPTHYCAGFGATRAVAIRNLVMNAVAGEIQRA